MFNNTAMNAAADELASLITHIAIHTDTNLSSSSAESSADREAITWSVAADGTMTLDNGPLDFTGGSANGDAKRLGYWGASSGGTYYGGSPLTGDQGFNAPGA